MTNNANPFADLISAAAGATIPICAGLYDTSLYAYTPGSSPASEAEYYTVLGGVVVAVIIMIVLRRVPGGRYVVPLVASFFASIFVLSAASVALYYAGIR